MHTEVEPQVIVIPPGQQLALVDDDEVDRMIVTRVLEMSGLDNPVLEFSSAASFLAYVEENLGRGGVDVSLVLMDINMPGMSGLEALRILRSRPEAAQPPIVVMLTSSEAAQDMRRAKELGASDCLVKQSGLEHFVAAIDATFTNSAPTPE